MRVLTVSRNKLEMTRAQLWKPVITLGRSPTCDVILRAPGVQPFHFLVEWIGQGDFNPNEGMWAITDLSQSAPATEGDTSGEGVILSETAVVMGDFRFTAIDDKLEAKEVIGGTIQENVRRQVARGAEILEVVQVRMDSGAIEEVKHLPVMRRDVAVKPLSRVREFRVQWQADQSSALLKVLLEEMPGAEVFKRGQKLVPSAGVPLQAHDVLHIVWNGREFYLRFVSNIHAPAVPHDVLGDPLLRRTAIGVLLFAFLFVGVVKLVDVLMPPKAEEPPPLRVATVEVPKEAAPPPPPPPPPPKPEVKKEEVATKTPPKKADIPLPKSKPNTKPAKAAAPKYEHAATAKPKVGLNSPGKEANVNTIGVLGALSKAISKGKGVQADKILNEGIITDAASNKEDTSAKIVVKNPPAGVLGSGDHGSPRGKGETDLAAASTTLRGTGKFDPNSGGPIARKGGGSGYHLGSGTTEGGSGFSASGADIGSLDGNEMSVEGGGLDRETVRRVIKANQGLIRTCYERALLSKSNLAGRLVFRWRISPDGPVVSVEFRSSTVESESLQACVQDVIKQMRFPRAPNGKATVVNYPFVFRPLR